LSCIKKLLFSRRKKGICFLVLGTLNRKRTRCGCFFRSQSRHHALPGRRPAARSTVVPDLT
jgi:hypothetical protein